MKKRKFWLVWLIYMVLLAVLIFFMWKKVWNTMVIFEDAQPEKVAEQFVESLQEGKYLPESTGTGSKFEAADIQTKIYKESIAGKNLTYKMQSNTNNRIVYNVYAGDDKVAKFALAGSNERNMMMLLSIFDWSVEDVEFRTVSGNCNVRVKVPDGYRVAINGIELGDEERVGEPEPVENMEYVAEYVEVPTYVAYEVHGLIETPKLELWDKAGNSITVPDDPAYLATEKWTICLNVGYMEEDMPAELETYAIQAAKDYSNFFSRDLAGCQTSTACLQKYFPKNSYYIELAERYRTGDMWMYSGHTAPEFSNLSVIDYVQYSDDCFSCRVIFDKSMYLKKTGATRVEHNDQTYYYVNINGSWVIADIKSNIEE